jgi:hypothetical protein
LRDPKLRNIPPSIRQKLLNLARERNEDFGLILPKYGLERILFRLSRSKYREVFILKGALLFEPWTGLRYRPTRDADFLATGDNSPEHFVQIFRGISAGRFRVRRGTEFLAATTLHTHPMKLSPKAA